MVHVVSEKPRECEEDEKHNAKTLNKHDLHPDETWEEVIRRKLNTA